MVEGPSFSEEGSSEGNGEGVVLAEEQIAEIAEFGSDPLPEVRESEVDEDADIESEAPFSFTPRDRGRAFFLLAICVFVACLGGLVMGYPLGVVAGVLPKLHDDYGLSTFGQELIASSIIFGAMCSSVSGGPIPDFFGRKWTMIVTSTAGAVVVMIMAASVSPLMLGLVRIFQGVFLGVTILTTPTYVGETCVPKYRGMVLSLFQLFVALGILVSYIVALIFNNTEYSWRFQIGANCFFYVIFAVFVLLVAPESPRWMAEKGRNVSLRKFLRRYYGILTEKEQNLFIEKLLEDIREGQSAKGLRAKFGALGRSWKQLGLGVLMGIAQQLTGINAIIFYAPMIVETAGLSKGTASLAATVGVGAWNALSTLVSVFFVDRLGRRPLLLTAFCMMAVACFLMAIAFIIPGLGTLVVSICALTSLFVFVAGFEIGPGPLFFTIASEIFPQDARAIGVSFWSFCQWTGNLIIVLCFVSVSDWIGQGWTFAIFFFVTLGSLLGAFLFIPETKGKSIEENVAAFRRKGKRGDYERMVDQHEAVEPILEDQNVFESDGEEDVSPIVFSDAVESSSE